MNKMNDKEAIIEYLCHKVKFIFPDCYMSFRDIFAQNFELTRSECDKMKITVTANSGDSYKTENDFDYLLFYAEYKGSQDEFYLKVEIENNERNERLERKKRIIEKINNEVSDSMSCTSGYSMYTNESSSISGFTNTLRFLPEQNIANNLQSRTGNQNSTSTTNPNANTVNTNSIIRSYTTPQTSQSSTQIPTTNQTQQTSSNANAFSVPRYVLNSSSSELPFIQRLNFSNSLHPNYYNNLSQNQQNPYDIFPKINLQVPPLLNPVEMPMVNGYNPLDEQNIILFSRNVYFDGAQSPPNQNPPVHHPQTSQENAKTIDNKSDSEDNDSKQEKQHMNNTFQLINTNPYINRNMQAHRTGSVLSGRSTLSADQMYTKNYKQFKIDNDNTNEMPINLLSLNKDNNFTENYMESISIKSDKNPSLKNKNLSYKSVSEVNEFDESGEDDEDKKDNGGTSQHTEESGYIKEFLEGEENNMSESGNTIQNLNLLPNNKNNNPNM